MVQPVVVGARQCHRPIGITKQTDIEPVVGIEHGCGNFRRIQESCPELRIRMFSLVRPKPPSAPPIPRKERILALTCHTAIRRRQKFSQLPIPLDHMAVSIDDRKRSFHDWSPFYRSSTTSPSRPSTRARENCNDEFQKLDRYAAHDTDRGDLLRN